MDHGAELTARATLDADMTALHCETAAIIIQLSAPSFQLRFAGLSKRC